MGPLKFLIALIMLGPPVNNMMEVITIIAMPRPITQELGCSLIHFMNWLYRISVVAMLPKSPVNVKDMATIGAAPIYGTSAGIIEAAQANA